MNFYNGMIAFVCIWWIVFFITLPFGIHPSPEEVPGHDPGAPAKTYLWHKVAVTTLISALLLLALPYVLTNF